MARFLSPEWFALFEEELSRLDVDPKWAPLDLGQEIRDAPGGTVRYTIRVGSGSARLDIGTTNEAAVTLVEDFDTARAIAAGTPVSELLSAGKITLRGDANTLLVAQAPLGAIAAVLGDLARATEV